MTVLRTSSARRKSCGRPVARGKGYATETARAALVYGFSDIGLELIFAISNPDHLSSQAVMKRLGMTYAKNVVYKDIDAGRSDIGRRSWLDELVCSVTPMYRR